MAFTGTRKPVESEVVPVPPSAVEKLWKDVRRIIHSRYHARYPALVDYDDDRLHNRLLLGREVAWLVITPEPIKPLIGVIITSITERPPTERKVFGRTRSLTVHLAAGRRIESWIEQAAERISAYGHAHGCRELFILSRRGWMQYLPHFLNRGWDQVGFSRDRHTRRDGRKRRNRTGHFIVVPSEIKCRDPKHYQ